MWFARRGRLPSSLAATALALVAVGCTPMQRAPASNPSQVVVLVSLDGFRADYIERHSPPALLSLINEGVRAEWMTPSFPTNTFPNHYTIVTGLRPENHGIVHNTMYDPDFGVRFAMGTQESMNPRWWGGEPIWVTAEKQGVRAASFFWVGSDVAIGGVRPSRWVRYDRSVPYATRVDSVLTWLSLPREQRPRLVTLYFEEPDHTGHNDGPNAPSVHGAVLRADSALARLIAGLHSRGLYDSVNLIVVSDHGMAELSPERVVYLSDGIDTSAIQAVTWGAVFTGWSRTGDNAGLAAALNRLPYVTAWLRETTPERLHYRNNERVPRVVALADEGWQILPGRRSRVPHGGHGYDNLLPSMRTIFVARGPAFRRGVTIPAFDNIHVYALLAHLLAVKPAPNVGTLDPFRAALIP